MAVIEMREIKREYRMESKQGEESITVNRHRSTIFFIVPSLK